MKKFNLLITLLFLALCNPLIANSLTKSQQEFKMLLDIVRTDFRVRNVNNEIIQLEKLAKSSDVDIAQFGLGRGVFNFWRKITSKNAISSTKFNCEFSYSNTEKLSIDNLKEDSNLEHNLTGNTELISVLTPKRVQEVFQILRGMETDLVFTEYGNGCESRAYKMAMLMDRLCINSAKAFIESEKIQLKDHSWSWGYHVAPIVYVKHGTELVLYIFDPAMFDQAVPLEIWIQELRRENPLNHYAVSLTSKYILLPYQKNLNHEYYREQDQETATERILKQRFMRFVRPFISPLKNPSP